jgi:hypothetical protein
MRAVIPAIPVLAILLCGNAFAGSNCVYDAKTEGSDQSGGAQAATPQFSSFRGISLASTPQEVVDVGNALGLLVEPYSYVGSNAVAGINFYTRDDWTELGVVSFDRSGHMIRLSLKDRFFCATPIFVRRFAEEVFEHYAVTTKTEADDVCFQDVTCFKGRSKSGEQFLILRIGTTAELYVRP